MEWWRVGQWDQPDGDTAQQSRNAGGGAPTTRLAMPADEAVKLYRRERSKRLTIREFIELQPRPSAGLFVASRSTP